MQTQRCLQVASQLAPRDSGLNNSDLFSTERDNFAPCGAQVFKDCIASVPNPMQNVIRAMELFLTCVEEKKDTCSASLIQHFVNLAKEVRAVLSAEEPALV